MGDQSIFSAFDRFVETPRWDLSSPDMMRDHGWTRLAWWNCRKVAVYLAAIDFQSDDDRTNLGVFVLTPGTCIWAHSIDFSELLTYFTAILRLSGCVDLTFARYAAYEMARFIEIAVEDHDSDYFATLFELLNVRDPVSEPDEDLAAYKMLQELHQEPPSLLDKTHARYQHMLDFYYMEAVDVLTLKRLTWGDLTDKNGVFLADTPALDSIIIDYNKTFLNEKPAKRPKRTTNVRELLWNSYPHVCGLCGEQIASIDEMHVDHIIPLSRGGKDILANLQLTHARCNMDKGNTLFEESEE